jgi:hypothetical protein
MVMIYKASAAKSMVKTPLGLLDKQNLVIKGRTIDEFLIDLPIKAEKRNKNPLTGTLPVAFSGAEHTFAQPLSQHLYTPGQSVSLSQSARHFRSRTAAGVGH